MITHWDAEGVTLTVPPTGDATTPTTQRLSHPQIAALTDYEALLQGIPASMQASLLVRVDGRIDMPNFRITHSIEPLNHLHAWVVYERVGALLWVGERMMRLNLKQLHVLDAIDHMHRAENDIAARLRAWPLLRDTLLSPGHQHVVLTNDLPRVHLTLVDQLPATSLTRIGKQLHRLADSPDAAWSMAKGHRYFLKRG